MTAFDTAIGECERTPGIDYGTRMVVAGDTLCIVTNETVAGNSLPEGTAAWDYSLPDDGQLIDATGLLACWDSVHCRRRGQSDSSGYDDG